MTTNPELAVVIPVFNEERNIPGLIADWKQAFTKTGVSYQIYLIDDGSTDKTALLLQALRAQDSCLVVHSQPNSGHGAAILKGYHMAVGATWIFQIDGDHQLNTDAFGRLWENRDGYDLLLAERAGKKASLPRHCISLVSRLMVRLLFGGGVKDVNTPYRLIRSALLRQAMDKISRPGFAPNTLLTSWFILRKHRIFTTVTAVPEADNSRTSKMNLYFLSGSLQAAWQMILFRIRL